VPHVAAAAVSLGAAAAAQRMPAAATVQAGEQCDIRCCADGCIFPGVLVVVLLQLYRLLSDIAELQTNEDFCCMALVFIRVKTSKKRHAASELDINAITVIETPLHCACCFLLQLYDSTLSFAARKELPVSLPINSNSS
jgi:hypothetical protein